MTDKNIKTGQLDKRLGIIKEAGETGQTSLFANIDLENPDIFGVQQVVKEALDITKDITEAEIEDQEKKRQRRGSKDLEFRKEAKGIRFEPSRAWGLTPQKVDGGEIISRVGNIRDARFLQSIGSIYSFAVRRGGFWITNSKLTDILKDTGAYTGKRIDPETIKKFSEDVILAHRLDLQVKTPTYSYRNKKGELITKKVGKYEAFENYISLFRLKGVLWATDRQGNKTFIKRIVDAEILPDIPNKTSLRGDVFVKGFFKLNAENEANRVFLGWYCIGRFTQRQTPTEKNEPFKITRGRLIKEAKYDYTDRLNKAEASNKLEATLNRLQELDVIGGWEMSPDKSQKIPTDDHATALIYPPKVIVKSLITRTKKEPLKDEKEYIKKLKRHKANIGLSATAKWLNCQPEDIDKMINGEIMPGGDKLEKLLSD